MIAPSQTLVSLIGAYGLAAVPLLMAAESCGRPFPREVIMLVAGASAGVRSRNSGRSTGRPGATVGFRVNCSSPACGAPTRPFALSSTTMRATHDFADSGDWLG